MVCFGTFVTQFRDGKRTESKNPMGVILDIQIARRLSSVYLRPSLTTN
jgi:hypothetical protein